MTNEQLTRRSTREIDWRRLIEVALEAPGNVGNVYNRFYDYSFMNQMLLRLQGVNEPVATYKRWQASGRQVLRGSKAHMIVRPIMISKETEDGEKEGALVGFKPVASPEVV